MFDKNSFWHKKNKDDDFMFDFQEEDITSPEVPTQSTNEARSPNSSTKLSSYVYQEKNDTELEEDLDEGMMSIKDTGKFMTPPIAILNFMPPPKDEDEPEDEEEDECKILGSRPCPRPKSLY
jgi:hypothetical protein